MYKLYFSKVEKLAEEKEAFYFRPYRDEAVFCYENNVAGTNTLNRIIPEKLCRRAGLERKTAYSLRVTCATRLYQNSVDDQRARERTGHKSNALERYERPYKEQICKVSECLGVPKKVNSSGNNVYAACSDVVIMQKKAMSDDYETGLFECEVFDEVLGNINVSSVGEDGSDDFGGNCVVKIVL